MPVRSDSNGVRFAVQKARWAPGEPVPAGSSFVHGCAVAGGCAQRDDLLNQATRCASDSDSSVQVKLIGSAERFVERRHHTVRRALERGEVPLTEEERQDEHVVGPRVSQTSEES